MGLNNYFTDLLRELIGSDPTIAEGTSPIDLIGANRYRPMGQCIYCLDEMTWRFDNRKNPFLFRDTMPKLIHPDNLEYKELTTAA
jgi:hypothetical protein